MPLASPQRASARSTRWQCTRRQSFERCSAADADGVSAARSPAEEFISSGIYEVTQGRFKVIGPFHEHATVLAGEVELSDEDGHAAVFGPGDSWFCHQGEVITWEVRSERLESRSLS